MTRPKTGGAVVGERVCAGCGRPIEVPANNPHKRYCSPRCRVADWHHRNDRPTSETPGDRRGPAGIDIANVVPAPNAVTNAVTTANAANPGSATPRCPHCHQPITVLNLLLPPDAAHVAVPDHPPGR